MVHLYLFAEGQTEQTFADITLKPHLSNFGVYMRNPVLIAHARRKRQVHRGGGRRYEPMKNDIVRFFKQEPGRNVFFTTMIDLYNLHSGFPGKADAEKLLHDPHQRVRALESSWAEDMCDSRFLPFIQLHEFEAFLFADVTKFKLCYQGEEAAIDRLMKISGTVQTPELIDDGESTSPSKRIINELPKYKGAKCTVGPQIAEAIGLSEIRAKCPHFDSWLTKLEKLDVDVDA